mmetsp:Transcript_27548/g.85407  ORF Transcript_27548/g.85407 Transcript_27548/m.85407 type:complete len:211 (-) Transcript_27548:82-714(-)
MFDATEGSATTQVNNGERSAFRKRCSAHRLQAGREHHRLERGTLSERVPWYAAQHAVGDVEVDRHQLGTPLQRVGPQRFECRREERCFQRSAPGTYAGPYAVQILAGAQVDGLQLRARVQDALSQCLEAWGEEHRFQRIAAVKGMVPDAPQVGACGEVDFHEVVAAREHVFSQCFQARRKDHRAQHSFSFAKVAPGETPRPQWCASLGTR